MKSPIEEITENMLKIRLGNSKPITQEDMRQAVANMARTIAKQRSVAPPATNATRQRLRSHLPYILPGQPVPSHMRFQKDPSTPMEEVKSSHTFIWESLLDDLLPEDDILQDHAAIETYAFRVVDEIEKIWEYNTYPTAHRDVVEPYQVMEQYLFDERVETEVRKQMNRPENVLFDAAVKSRIQEVKSEEMARSLGQKDQIEKALSDQNTGKQMVAMQTRRQESVDQERERQKRFQREELERSLKSQFG